MYGQSIYQEESENKNFQAYFQNYIYTIFLKVHL